MIEDNIPIFGQEPIISSTDQFQNGDMSDPVYKEIVSILKDDFNLTPKDVFMKTTEDGRVRIFKKIKENDNDQS